MLSASTILEALSAAHAHGGAPALWADDVHAIVTRRVPELAAVETVAYTAADQRLDFLGRATLGRRSREVTRTGHESLTPEQRRRIYETSTFVRTVSGFYDAVPPPELAEGMAREGIGELVGVAQPEGDLRAALGFTVMVHAGVSVDDGALAPWATLVRQLGALSEARALLDGTRPGGGSADVSRAARELDSLRARAARRPGEDEARAALDLWGVLLDRGFAVLGQERSEGRRRVVAVRLRNPEWDALRRLSPDERRVAEAAARGLSNKEIAFELEIEEGTVASRLRRAEARLGVGGRVELVRLARALGFER